MSQQPDDMWTVMQKKKPEAQSSCRAEVFPQHYSTWNSYKTFLPF